MVILRSIASVALFDRLGLSRKRFDTLSTPLDIASPWQDSSNLQGVLATDIFGADIIDSIPLTRATAITIPAVSKARNLLVSTIAKFPLVAIEHDSKSGTDKKVTKQPRFLYRTSGNVSPYERMAWTIDDLIFHGVSLWATERYAEENGFRGQIRNAEWVPPKDWKITNGKIQVLEQDVDDDDVILFNSPFEGLLNIANRTLRGARDVELAWTERIKHPIFITELNVTQDDALTQQEMEAWEAAWLKKHKSGNPSFGITPYGTQLHTHGDENGDASMFLESRNAVRTDVGSFLNVRASMLDGTAGIDSLTYSTTEGEKNSFYEFDLPFWTDPITAALSQDKAGPRGQRIRFDMYEAFTNPPSPTGAPTED